MFKVMGGVRSVSHVGLQGDGRGTRSVSHVQGDGRGEGASAMFKVMGGDEKRQPCRPTT